MPPWQKFLDRSQNPVGKMNHLRARTLIVYSSGSAGRRNQLGQVWCLRAAQSGHCDIDLGKPQPHCKCIHAASLGTVFLIKGEVRICLAANQEPL